ncbi:MAG: glycoside hydrolase family 3 protein [Lachnospiraceae bacterium]|nr:glycoside hydrolase family 3 protein [Lachnospiraceae bacterium]
MKEESTVSGRYGIDLRANPFRLDKDALDWVEETFLAMSTEQKAGQVFCPMGFTDDEKVLSHLIRDLGIGGMMYRADFAANIRRTHKRIQDMAKIPLLLAANTEAGGDGLAFEGTSFGKPMAVAATNEPENAYRMGLTACKEGAALGLNWSFAPIVDIDYEFHNPITNVRTFGNDPAKVAEYASRYLDGAKDAGVAACIKHFPGDGVDERDQHIVTSVNSMSVEEWENSFGGVYRALIEKGAPSVMAGHIAQPAWVRRFNPAASAAESLLPASLSQELLGGLLRGHLGFNGLISTDATPMVGFTSAMPRRKAIPMAIESGCDVILFNKDIEEDYRYLLDGLENGTLSFRRLDEAVLRILAMKAALGLHIKQKEGTLVPGETALEEVGCPEYRMWAEQTAGKAITLVRDRDGLLPVSPDRYRRVYLNVIQKDPDPEHPFVQAWKHRFEEEGFDVKVRDRRIRIGVEDFADPSRMSAGKQKLMHEMYRSVGEMKQEYDLYVYICNMENASNNTTLRLNWNVCFGLGDDAPWLAAEIPVMMISTACPYHLYDAPMIGTYINAYSGNDMFCDAVMERITGREAFTGVSPVDPFCGKDYI